MDGVKYVCPICAIEELVMITRNDIIIYRCPNCGKEVPDLEESCDDGGCML